MGKTNLGRVSVAPRGAYNNETSYKRLDVVEYEGSSYLFLKDSTGIDPTGDGEVTMLLAKKGKDFIYDDFTPEQLAGLKGEKGDKGDLGKGFTILGYYGTLDLLKASVTTPEPGDVFGIGTAAPYDIYVFDGVTNDWVDNGTMSGGGGASSEANIVFIPFDVMNLNSTSTSNDIIEAFGGRTALNSVIDNLKAGDAITFIVGQGTNISCTIAISPDADYNNFGLYIETYGEGVMVALDIASQDGELRINSGGVSALLLQTNLISDPSVGGTDKPASAEAVKIVNESLKTHNHDGIYQPIGIEGGSKIYMTTLPIYDILSGTVGSMTEEHIAEIHNIISKKDCIILCPNVPLLGDDDDYGMLYRSGSVRGAVLTVEESVNSYYGNTYKFHIITSGKDERIWHFVIDLEEFHSIEPGRGYFVEITEPNKTTAIWGKPRLKVRLNTWYRFNKIDGTRIDMPSKVTAELDFTFNISSIDSVLYAKVIEWKNDMPDGYAFYELQWKKDGIPQRYTGWLKRQEYILTTADKLDFS